MHSRGIVGSIEISQRNTRPVARVPSLQRNQGWQGEVHPRHQALQGLPQADKANMVQNGNAAHTGDTGSLEERFVYFIFEI